MGFCQDFVQDEYIGNTFEDNIMRDPKGPSLCLIKI